MAAISAFPSSLCCQISRASSSLPSPCPSFPTLRHLRGLCTSFSPLQWRTPLNKPIRAVAEEAETLAPEEEAPPAEQPVSVPVSPSDFLTMFFKAEGSMDEAAIPRVSKALQEVEGISDLKVQVLEGIARVEVTKQTTVQATGVASNLVEIIQGSGFKLQTLNLSFEDEEDFVNS